MYITSTGMVCPVGLNAAAACAAMRAGIANFIELPYHDDQGEPIIGAMVPGLSRELRCAERLIELLSMATSDCLQEQVSTALEKIPLLVGLAEPGRLGRNAGLTHRIIGEVEGKLDVQFHPQLSCALPRGHTSGFEALRMARKLLTDPSVPACLVTGVDSYINASSLLWLEQHWRLKTDENSDGVIPGEAAAAILVQRQIAPGTETGVKLTGLGFGNEKATVLSEEPLLGLGLSDAVRSALVDAGIKMHEIDFRLSDVTGESYGFREQMLTLARLMRVLLEERIPLWHYTEFIGDTGAAAGVLQLVAAYRAFKKGYAPGNRCICYTSAISGERAVAVIQTIGIGNLRDS